VVEQRCCTNTSPSGVLLRRHMAKQDYAFRYHVRDWSNYNRALVDRGPLTIQQRCARLLSLLRCHLYVT